MWRLFLWSFDVAVLPETWVAQILESGCRRHRRLQTNASCGAAPIQESVLPKLLKSSDHETHESEHLYFVCFVFFVVK